MHRILVTGGAGFIGSHLVSRLVSEGRHVGVLDNFDPFYCPTQKRKNLSGISCIVHECDIRSEKAVAAILSEGWDCVVHLAALAGVRQSFERARDYADVNVCGTAALLEACKLVGVQKVVFASSSSVYGIGDGSPTKETHAVAALSPYAATKIAGESLCQAFAASGHVDCVALRFFTVYGPRQRPDLAIHKFSRLIAAGLPLPVYGNGLLLRDFTFVDDIVSGVVAAVDVPHKGFEVYNLGNGQPVSVGQCVDLLERAIGRRAEIEHLPKPSSDSFATHADISKAANALGYDPQTSFESGMQKFANWFSETLDK